MTGYELGMVYFVGVAGVGAFVAGLDYDLTGNYHLSLLLNSFMGFAAAAVIGAVRVRPLAPLAAPAPPDRPAAPRPALTPSGDD